MGEMGTIEVMKRCVECGGTGEIRSEVWIACEACRGVGGCGMTPTTDVTHSSAVTEDDDGWLIVRCECGWEFGAVPDDDHEQVTDALMDHATQAETVRMMRRFGRILNEIHQFIVTELDPDPRDRIGAYIGNADDAAFADFCQRSSGGVA